MHDERSKVHLFLKNTLDSLIWGITVQLYFTVFSWIQRHPCLMMCDLFIKKKHKHGNTALESSVKRISFQKEDANNKGKYDTCDRLCVRLD